MKKVIIGFLIILLSILAICFGITAKDPIIIPIHTNDIQFTTTFDSSATLLIPAAYTENNKPQGEYRIAGITYGSPVRKERISITSTGLIISGSWQSDYGFQQTVLIKNHKIRYHNDSKYAFRRVLATVDGQLTVLQSKIPMTLNQFSESIHPICSNAVNLDMGDYGYGWYKHIKFSSIFKYNQSQQTNWLYIP